MYQSMCSSIGHFKTEEPDRHGKNTTAGNETRHARFPLSNFLPQAGERANESLREFLVKAPVNQLRHSTKETASALHPVASALRYFAILLLLCSYGTAVAGLRDETPDKKNRGEQIFKLTCSVCHGEKGGGAVWGKLKPPARDFTSPESFAKLTRERMIYSVTNGRPGTAMQPFASQLSQSDIEAVVDYIRKTFIANGRTSDMSLPFPKGLKGNRVRGGFLFHANCAPCHGQSGDGKGDRAYFINPKPRNFLAPESRRWLNRPILFQIISQGSLGTDMPSWDKVFDEQEIADVAEHVFQRFIQGKPALKGEDGKK